MKFALLNKNRLVLQSFIFLLLFTLNNCFAQNTQNTKTTPTTDSIQKTGFEWLKQFEGNWDVTSSEPPVQGKPEPAKNKATMTSRSVGKLWVIINQKGQIGETTFESFQTIGYNAQKKLFEGSWIDSVTNFTWVYSGDLDESGRLVLTAEGPDWNEPTKSRKYRDIYEFKSKDKIATISQMQNDEGEWDTFMLGSMVRSKDDPKTAGGDSANQKLPSRVTPFLMFEGKAEAAIEFYKSIFPNSHIESMKKYKAGEAGKEGTVYLATFVVEGQRVKCIDSPIAHDFDFTPSFSFFVECENEKQIQERFKKLSEGGKVMMRVGEYGFSKKFAWVSDRFGVSWQLNLK